VSAEDGNDELQQDDWQTTVQPMLNCYA